MVSGGEQEAVDIAKLVKQVSACFEEQTENMWKSALASLEVQITSLFDKLKMEFEEVFERRKGDTHDIHHQQSIGGFNNGGFSGNNSNGVGDLSNKKLGDAVIQGKLKKANVKRRSRSKVAVPSEASETCGVGGTGYKEDDDDEEMSDDIVLKNLYTKLGNASINGKVSSTYDT
ncbi:unnamed protein product [Microthlaspi erraticum]|uniref:Uncharacterized protein n=1 Tax=Microthlaspi erraticum TaxID=1685480 RepID=A0A6D2IYP1_9BRAS|nr:unnamed protein product [Microthlaspi erraticum]